MEVEIDYQCPLDASLLEQNFDCYGDVMNHTKAPTTIGKGMMVTAAKIGCQQPIECDFASQFGATGFDANVVNQGRKRLGGGLRVVFEIFEFEYIQPGCRVIE